MKKFSFLVQIVRHQKKTIKKYMAQKNLGCVEQIRSFTRDVLARLTGSA